MGGFFAGTALGPASLFSHCFGGGGGGDLTSAGEGWNSCWPEAALCPPLCLSPSLRLHLFPPCLCPPSCSFFSPLSPAPLCLSAFGVHRSLCALSAHPASARPTSPFHRCRPPFSMRSVRLSFSPASLHLIFPSPLSACLFSYLCLSASPFHLCRPPFSMCSGSLPFRRFLSACFFLCLSPPVFLPTFVRPSFPLPLSAHFFPPLSAHFFFPLSPAVLYGLSPAFLRRFSLPVCLFVLSTPVIHRSFRLFPSAFSIRPCLPNFPLHPFHPPISPAFSRSIVFSIFCQSVFPSAPAATFSPSLFSRPCPPARQERGEVP